MERKPTCMIWCDGCSVKDAPPPSTFIIRGHLAAEFEEVGSSTRHTS